MAVLVRENSIFKFTNLFSLAQMLSRFSSYMMFCDSSLQEPTPAPCYCYNPWQKPLRKYTKKQILESRVVFRKGAQSVSILLTEVIVFIVAVLRDVTQCSPRGIFGPVTWHTNKTTFKVKKYLSMEVIHKHIHIHIHIYRLSMQYGARCVRKPSFLKVYNGLLISNLL